MRYVLAIALLLFAAPAGAYTMDDFYRHYYSHDPVQSQGARSYLYGSMNGLQENELYFMRKTVPGYRLYCGRFPTRGDEEQDFLRYMEETKRGWAGSEIYARSFIFAWHRDRSNCGQMH